jgi:transposase
MGRAYSLDLRERFVAAVTEGESCRSVAATFKVSVASVVKWSQRFRATGSAASRRMGGNRPYVLSSERDWLLKRLADERMSDETVKQTMLMVAEECDRFTIGAAMCSLYELAVSRVIDETKGS